MGLSGSGKSTLMRAVNGLNRPVARQRAACSEDDEMVDVATCNAEVLRRIRMQRVAMVFQQFALLPWRTVAENAGFGLELAGVPEAERRERVMKQLEMVGLTQWAEKYAEELSGGMQQRVGLARAFATDAPILLMDEPFSALDPLIRTKLQDELLELQRHLKRTIIFVSHDLDEALKIGTRIAIMESGRIVQYGPPQDIVLKPANDYVRDFVAHMNPLNVLRAQEVMTPFAALPKAGDGERGGDRRGPDADGERRGGAPRRAGCGWWRWRTWTRAAATRVHRRRRRYAASRADRRAAGAWRGPFVVREAGAVDRPHPRRGPFPLPDQYARAGGVGRTTGQRTRLSGRKLAISAAEAQALTIRPPSPYLRPSNLARGQRAG